MCKEQLNATPPAVLCAMQDELALHTQRAASKIDAQERELQLLKDRIRSVACLSLVSAGQPWAEAQLQACMCALQGDGAAGASEH